MLDWWKAIRNKNCSYIHQGCTRSRTSKKSCKIHTPNSLGAVLPLANRDVSEDYQTAAWLCAFHWIDVEQVPKIIKRQSHQTKLVWWQRSLQYDTWPEFQSTLLWMAVTAVDGQFCCGCSIEEAFESVWTFSPCHAQDWLHLRDSPCAKQPPDGYGMGQFHYSCQKLMVLNFDLPNVGVGTVGK